MQERRNSSPLAMELRLPCTNPWIYKSALHGILGTVQDVSIAKDMLNADLFIQILHIYTYIDRYVLQMVPDESPLDSRLSQTYFINRLKYTLGSLKMDSAVTHKNENCVVANDIVYSSTKNLHRVYIPWYVLKTQVNKKYYSYVLILHTSMLIYNRLWQIPFS